MAAFLRLLQTLIVAYGVMVAVLFVLQRALLYRPPQIDGSILPSDFAGLQLQTVTTADGLVLRVWFKPPQAGKPVAVLFYGNASAMIARVNEGRALASRGYGVLFASYRLYDGNPGSPSEQGLYMDARASLNWLKSHGYSFFLMGQSLGSGVAVQMATEYPVAALILETPYTSMADAASYHYPFVPVRWLLRDRYDSSSKIRQIHAPVLVIQGDADEVIPVEQGHKLFEAANEPKQAIWVRGARHNNYYSFGAWPEVVAFIDKYAGEPTDENPDQRDHP